MGKDDECCGAEETWATGSKLGDRDQYLCSRLNRVYRFRMQPSTGRRRVHTDVARLVDFSEHRQGRAWTGVDLLQSSEWGTGGLCGGSEMQSEGAHTCPGSERDQGATTSP